MIAGEGVDMFKEEGFEIIIVDTSGQCLVLQFSTQGSDADPYELFYGSGSSIKILGKNYNFNLFFSPKIHLK